MVNAKRGLGKGLGALIPETSVLTGGRTIVNIDVSKIVTNPRQPREDFPTATLQELADSIKAQGIAQPVLARQRGEKYELVAGERRWRAAKLAGLKLIPAIIKDFSDEESLEMSLVENLQREDLNPIEEAEGYQRLLKEFKLTQAEIAKRVGKDRSTVANALRILELPKEIQAALRKRQLNVGHARPLLSLQNPEAQLAIFREILKKNLNVRDVETLIHGAPERMAVRKRKKRHTKNEELNDLVELLTVHLGTKVSIYGTIKRGRIQIEYYSKEDLERLIELITGGEKLI